MAFVGRDTLPNHLKQFGNRFLREQHALQQKRMEGDRVAFGNGLVDDNLNG